MIRPTAFSADKLPPAPPQYDRANEQKFRALVATAFSKVMVATNDLSSEGTGLSLLGWTHSLVFSSTDNDTVAWSSGSIGLRDGTVYSIDAGNTGNMVAPTYVFLDLAVSSTVLQTTIVPSAAVGRTRILIAVAKNVASGKSAQYQVMGGADNGELILLTADIIAANTITANEIAANTITAAEIAAGTITATQIAADTITGANIASLSISTKTIVADTGTVGGWTLSNSELSAGSMKLQATAERILIGAATDVMMGTGIFLGLSGGQYQFRAGDPDGTYIRWDGSAWSGTLASPIVVASTSFTATTAVFTGDVTVGGVAPNHVGILGNDSGGFLTVLVGDATAQTGIGVYATATGGKITAHNVDAGSPYAYFVDVMEFEVDSSGNLTMTMEGLPTSDPGGTNRVWRDGGVLKIT